MQQCVLHRFFVDRGKATLLISWQMLQHLLFEEGAVEVGVYLRRINTLVSQHSLNGT